jgi:hypothetical protein
MNLYKNGNNSRRHYGPMIRVDVRFHKDNVKWPTKINIKTDEAIHFQNVGLSLNYTSSLRYKSVNSENFSSRFSSIACKLTRVSRGARPIFLETTCLCHHGREFSRRYSHLLLLHNPFQFNSSCWGNSVSGEDYFIASASSVIGSPSCHNQSSS